METRIAALEKGAAFNATQEAVRARETEFLTTLREMKENLVKEQEEAKGSGASSGQVESLEKENAALKAKLKKHEYRIAHLVAGLEEFMAAKK